MAAADTKCQPPGVLPYGIETLEFRHDGVARGIRGVFPQMARAAGEDLGILAIRCENAGLDGAKVRWVCEATTPGVPPHRIVDASVSFEGFSRPGDECVRLGTEVLTYSVERLETPAPVPGGTPLVSDSPPKNFVSAENLEIGTPAPVASNTDFTTFRCLWVLCGTFVILVSLVVMVVDTYKTFVSRRARKENAAAKAPPAPEPAEKSRVTYVTE